ncbi:hypothetical protein KP509_07G073500 [Ceratopteris richardii]|uniref:Uncharacterized protein n=1 Tax=Ceratopteris richardii TaxID=49495 RepID=A0A8T2UML1_CERRI|nr:hypothetical protein KP509_07G073500 [Ceratopteris richardii]
MVLWEITLATAYWLGIRRTYRLALKLQRRLIGPEHPRARDFVHRRTRNVFDIALKVHKEIQSRDLSAGRSLGNFLLRFLDRARPSANIRGTPSGHCCESAGQKKLPAGGSADSQGLAARHSQKSGASKPSNGTGKLFFSQYVGEAPSAWTVGSAFNAGIWGRRTSIQGAKSILGHRHYSLSGPASGNHGFHSPAALRGSSFDRDVFRSDIALWMGVKGPRKTMAS